ncbi:MAG TPA: hypothetical protein VHS31_01300 [Tepidisphaeraceae bacterium]|nr:hypothetical protein [Tepidisphaeraceae bacterium]
MIEIFEKPHESAFSQQLEASFNHTAQTAGELRLTIPFACIEAQKPVWR